MHVMPVMVTATAQIGASGAVTSFVGSMVQSITRTAAGTYKVTLQPGSNFTRVYYAAGSMQSAPGGLSGAPDVEIQNAPNTPIAVNATPSITMKTLNPAGAATDPVSGSALNVLLILSNSSVLIGGE